MDGASKRFRDNRKLNARKSAEERRRHAEELARSNAELEAFAHTVAHDLREPLRTISAFTEILVGRTPLDSEERHWTKMTGR